MWLQLGRTRDFNFVQEEIMSLLHILMANLGYNCDPDFQTRDKQSILLFPWAGRLSRKPSRAWLYAGLLVPAFSWQGPCVPDGY